MIVKYEKQVTDKGEVSKVICDKAEAEIEHICYHDEKVVRPCKRTILK
jgi:hypothetical protein